MEEMKRRVIHNAMVTVSYLRHYISMDDLEEAVIDTEAAEMPDEFIMDYLAAFSRAGELHPDSLQNTAATLALGFKYAKELGTYKEV